MGRFARHVIREGVYTEVIGRGTSPMYVLLFVEQEVDVGGIQLCRCYSSQSSHQRPNQEIQLVRRLPRVDRANVPGQEHEEYILSLSFRFYSFSSFDIHLPDVRYFAVRPHSISSIQTSSLLVFKSPFHQPSRNNKSHIIRCDRIHWG